MVYILDTNIILRTLIKDDDQVLADCVELLGMVKCNKIEAVLPGIVLSEVVWVLLSFYKFPKTQVVKALKSVLKLSGLKLVDNYDYEQAIKLYENNQVKYVDCVIASLVTSRDFTVISYDKDFDKLKVKRLEPGSFRYKSSV